MAFTYTSTDPGSSGISYVRLRIGDTSSGSPSFQDEEIEAFLDTEGNKYLAAAVAAETLGAQNASKVDKQVGRLRISMAQASQHYFNLARRLRHEAAMRSPPFAAGISVDDKQTAESDGDRVAPMFTRDQFDHPGVDVGADESTAVF